MAQATVFRRRPCRQCGGRYFVGTMGVFAALIAFAAFLGGIALTVVNSGLINGLTNPAGPDVDTVFQHAHWAIGGLVVAMIAAIVGHGYRCINCDTPQ